MSQRDDQRDDHGVYQGHWSNLYRRPTHQHGEAYGVWESEQLRHAREGASYDPAFSGPGSGYGQSHSNRGYGNQHFGSQRFSQQDFAGERAGLDAGLGYRNQGQGAGNDRSGDRRSYYALGGNMSFGDHSGGFGNLGFSAGGPLAARESQSPVAPRPSQRGKGPVGYQRSDERIRERVCDALSDDDRIDASRIDVVVAKGEVALTGFVSDRRTKRAAEICVENLAGVVEVLNQLRVRPEPRSQARQQDDDATSTLA